MLYIWIAWTNAQRPLILSGQHFQEQRRTYFRGRDEAWTYGCHNQCII